MSASFASSLGTDALAPGTELIVGWSSRLSRYETERSVAVVSEHDAAPRQRQHHCGKSST
jgi:hypothetical protein